MKLNIFRRSKAEPEAPEVRVPLAVSFVRQVWESPATFNRATRRRVGLWGRIWRWDLNATDETRRTYVPRYLRRHYTAAVPRTRRQRRHRAVIMRIAREKGL